MFCAMDVNEALSRVDIVPVQSVEPQNTRHHKILSRRKRIAGLERHTASKNCPRRHFAADLLRYAKATDRSFKTPLLCSNAESRSGHWIGPDQCLTILEGEQLVSNGHVYFFHVSRAARTTRYQISDIELPVVSGQRILTVRHAACSTGRTLLLCITLNVAIKSAC